MRRTNTFRLIPEGGKKGRLYELCDLSSAFWNVITYKRRQTFFAKNIDFDWNTDVEYKDFVPKIGSATAQQIIRKNNEAWKSFFALLKKKKEGALPAHIKKVSPPGYWKDRRTKERVLRTLVRTDSYRINDRQLILPKKLSVKINGDQRWNGKQGRLEIYYDHLSKRWYAYMPVECEVPHQPIGDKKAYVDLGVINIITSHTEGDNRATIYSGRPLLSDWWYWNEKIANHQSKLEERQPSKIIRNLYRKRQRRFRQAINTIVYRFVKDCYEKGVSEITVGDLTHIRESGNKGRKTNSMVNNFWSHRYIIGRIRTTAENFGISLKTKDERGTSKTCCLCGKVHKNGRKHRGLYVCKTHNKAINADINGVANISNPIFPEPIWSRDNWVVANPLAISING